MSNLPTLKVEAAFGGYGNTVYLQFDDAARGLFNTAEFGQVTWTDITTYVRSCDIARGRARPLEAFQPGTCSVVLDNDDGRFDPNNITHGVYVSGGITQVLPMVPVKVSATYSGTTYPLFYGYADSWTVTCQQPNVSTSTLHCTDGFKVLNAYTPAAASGSTGAGDDTGARIARLLTEAGWSDTDRDLDVGASTVQATTFASNVLTEINEVVKAEAGDFYMSADGLATFRNRHDRLSSLYGLLYHQFADLGGSYLPYTDIGIAYDDTLIKNKIGATIANTGTLQQATSATSVAKYLPKTLNESSLWLQTDADALQWAQWQLVLFKDAELRVEWIDLAPQGDATGSLWGVALGSDFGTFFEVIRTPPVGDTITLYVFLDAVSHKIRPGQWTTRFGFTSAARYMSGIAFDLTPITGTGFDGSTYVFSY